LVRPFDHKADMQEAYYLTVNPRAEGKTDTSNFVRWIKDEMQTDYASSAVNARLGTQA
jgi:LysR family glycine cleavage system transcriptional activator